jgi:hypothetical protein
MLRIWRLGLPKGCAPYTVRVPEVKGGCPQRDFVSVTVFQAFGEGEFYALSHAVASENRAARMRSLRDPGPGYGNWLSSHPLAASGATHSNSGSWWRNQVNCRLA